MTVAKDVGTPATGLTSGGGPTRYNMNKQMTHLNPPIFDLHQDLLSHIRERDYFDDQWQTSYEHLEASPVQIIAATAWPTTPNDDVFHDTANRLIEADITAYAKLPTINPGWEVVTNLADLGNSLIAAAQPRKLVIHIEGLNRIDKSSWPMLERWYELGWRSASLTWNLTNSLGGGTNDSTSGLTKLGHEVVQWMTQRNMMVDLAHANEPTFWDVLRLISKPIWVSHANCRALCDTPRNLSDRQIRAIAENGGVIGITLIGWATDKNQPTLARLADHVDHIRRLVGIEHIALGSDLGGVASELAGGLTTPATLVELWGTLLERGYTATDIDSIAHGNALRVLGNQ